MEKQVVDEIKDLVTEARNPVSEDIDNKSIEDIVRIIQHENN